MNKATSTLIAAVAAFMLSGSVYAQSNNTLATPNTRSPAADTSDYGPPGATNSDSGAASPNQAQLNGTNMNSTPPAPAYGTNNTLATPTAKSPAAQ